MRASRAPSLVVYVRMCEFQLCCSCCCCFSCWLCTGKTPRLRQTRLNEERERDKQTDSQTMKREISPTSGLETAAAAADGSENEPPSSATRATRRRTRTATLRVPVEAPVKIKTELDTSSSNSSSSRAHRNESPASKARVSLGDVSDAILGHIFAKLSLQELAKCERGQCQCSLPVCSSLAHTHTCTHMLHFVYSNWKLCSIFFVASETNNY